MLAHTLAQQARRPSGILGRLFGMGMGRINRGVNDFVITQLDVQHNYKVLEIGFGPGKAIQQIERQLSTGRVYGIDMSGTMVAQAAKLNRRAIEEGKVDLRAGEASRLPYPEGTFDRIFCVNVMYFWPEPQQELGEMFRVTAPGGQVAIYIGDREQMSDVPMTKTGLFRLFSGEDVAALLRAAGFDDCRILEASIEQGPISRGCCVLGKRPLGM